MNNQSKNPCIRCGTERVISKRSQEKVGNSIVYTTESVCPNKDCQKQVNKVNKKALDKYLSHKSKSEERARLRQHARVAKREAATA
jgi:hypothetical protein